MLWWFLDIWFDEVLIFGSNISIFFSSFEACSTFALLFTTLAFTFPMNSGFGCLSWFHQSVKNHVCNLSIYSVEIEMGMCYDQVLNFFYFDLFEKRFFFNCTVCRHFTHHTCNWSQVLLCLEEDKNVILISR